MADRLETVNAIINAFFILLDDFRFSRGQKNTEAFLNECGFDEQTAKVLSSISREDAIRNMSERCKSMVTETEEKVNERH